MVYAGTNATSFKQAGADLAEEAELTVSEQRIMRATKRIGEERIVQREAEIEHWEQLPLPEQQCSPREQVPAVAVAEMDGGRLQIRERKPSPEEEKHSSHWREMKVGCLLTVASEVHAEDPCPNVPILDFIHALCYVFTGALAGRRLREGWPIYCQWAQWVWSGQVERVIEALKIRQQEVGLPEADESEESPRQKVADALRYLQNQKTRMRYDEYRRQGLPITSSHIESTIKQINRRVKGTEKFWSGRGAEALLQLAADYLSETKPLTAFWRERPNHATGQRCYQAAS